MMLEAAIPYSKGISALSKNAGTILDVAPMLCFGSDESSAAEEVEEDGEED